MYKIIFLVLLILLIVAIILNIKKKQNVNITVVEDKIMIDEQTFNMMTDIVTNYSLKSVDLSQKLVLIYRATFHLFDMNYPSSSIELLDNYLAKYKYEYSDYEFPQGDMFLNLQKFIITNITNYIVNSEKQFQNNFEDDRIIIYVYLKNLLTHAKLLN